MIPPFRAAARLKLASAALVVFSVISVNATSFVTAAHAAAPPIRLSPRNQVPACATPEALNAFLANQALKRRRHVAPQFRNIAHHYKGHGEVYRVRWDYAFFQMALETNFLSYRRGNGRRGDVRIRQNNFAGLGTTGGGVPGDSYPNVSTGVLAQIQHLVVYSGERLRNPVGHRTRLKQDVILKSIGRIARRRPVTFGDLARRWAADRRYGRSIQRLANLFYTGYCSNRRSRALPVVARAARPQRRRLQPAQPVPAPLKRTKAAKRTRTARRRVVAAKIAPVRIVRKTPPKVKVRPKPRLALQTAAPAAEPLPLTPSKSRLHLATPSDRPANTCKVQSASYGGKRAVLIENFIGGALQLTALNVHPGFEVAMAANFIQAYAPNGRTIGVYETHHSAIAKAQQICRLRTARK